MSDINLKNIIEQFPDCVTNGAKLKAILLDTYPEISKAMVNTLVIMANSGMAKEIQNTASPTELDKSRWQKQLEDEGFSENVICTCLNIFFFAVGLKVVCVQNDAKVDTSYIIEKKVEKQVVPTDLANFVIKDGVLIRYKGTDLVKNNDATTDIVIPDCVTTIGTRSFSKFSELTGVTIPDSITSIGDFAFESCNGLTSINIPDSVTIIRDYAFFNCDYLKSVNIPTKLTSIAAGTFCGCRRLTSITIPDSVTSIGQLAFDDCSELKDIVIPDRVTSIGDKTFKGCTGLTSVILPNSVTSIGVNVFFGCYRLSEIIFNGTIDEWDNIDKRKGCLNLSSIKKIVCSDGIIHV